MRLAFVDLLFSWPPHGGADVDLYQTASGLQARGHDVHLFVAARDDSWERGAFEPPELPFPSTRLVFTKRTLTPKHLARRFREAVDEFNPAVVFINDGFFLKPAVTLALAHYPTVGRFYAYEAGCIRDALLFKDGAPCPKDYLTTPDFCRSCALAGMKRDVLRWKLLAWTEEFVAARAYLPAYHARLIEALRSYKALLVYNPIMERHVASCNQNVHVVPGGVDVDEYAYVPPSSSEKTIILMSGRVEDPMKGLSTLREAGAKLATQRNDFEIWATHTDHKLNSNWFKAVGWHDHATMKTLYQQAHVCVTPSIWEEPFGLVAVEAMASGRPVVASRVGGLQEIVVHGETGFLFERQNAAELAAHLETLLDAPDQRLRMGELARKRAESLYDWNQIINQHYEPLLESVTT